MSTQFRNKAISSVLSVLKMRVQRCRILLLLHLTIVISLQPKFPAKMSIAVNCKSALKT